MRERGVLLVPARDRAGLDDDSTHGGEPLLLVLQLCAHEGVSGDETHGELDVALDRALTQVGRACAMGGRAREGRRADG